MREFKRCNPDANNFNKVIKIKSVEDWKADYVDLGQGIGYWIAENPFYDDGFDKFKEVIAAFPIQKNNSNVDSVDPNPFDTIHVPEWVHRDLCLLVRDFYLKVSNKTISSIADPQVHEWGNIYYKSLCKPITCWRIPHIDYEYGMVGNLWFTDHKLVDSSTKFYKYHGRIENMIYDFQIDHNHPMHEEWKSMAMSPLRSDNWFNTSDEDLKKWGFEYVGCAPTNEKTMSLYFSNITHTPFVSNNVDFRWSHAFAFSHLLGRSISMRDIFQ